MLQLTVITNSTLYDKFFGPDGDSKNASIIKSENTDTLPAKNSQFPGSLNNRLATVTSFVPTITDLLIRLLATVG